MQRTGEAQGGQKVKSRQHRSGDGAGGVPRIDAGRCRPGFWRRPSTYPHGEGKGCADAQGRGQNDQHRQQGVGRQAGLAKVERTQSAVGPGRQNRGGYVGQGKAGHRSPPVGSPPPGEAAAQGQAAQESGQHDGKGVYRTPEQMTQEPGPKNLVEKRSRTRAGDQRQDPLLAAPEAAAGGRRFRRPFPQVLRCRALGNEDGQSAYQSVNYNACQDRDLQSPARQQHKGGDQGAGHRADRVEHVEQAHARTDGRVAVYCIAGQKRQRRAHATRR